MARKKVKPVILKDLFCVLCARHITPPLKEISIVSFMCPESAYPIAEFLFMWTTSLLCYYLSVCMYIYEVIDVLYYNMYIYELLG